MSKARDHAVLKALAHVRDQVARPENLGHCVLCGALYQHRAECPFRRAREILGGFPHTETVDRGQPLRVTPRGDNQPTTNTQEEHHHGRGDS